MPKKASPIIMLVALILLLIAVGTVMLFQPPEQAGVKQSGTLKAGVAINVPRFLEQKELYKTTAKQELLGMKIARLEHRQHPQEFAVIQGMSPKLLNSVLDGKIQPSAITASANQMLKLRKEAVSVDIQKLEPLKTEMVEVQGLPLERRVVKVRFKVSNEEKPREYEGELLVIPGANPQSDRDSTIVLSFAKPENYQQKLFSEFYQQLARKETVVYEPPHPEDAD